MNFGKFGDFVYCIWMSYFCVGAVRPKMKTSMFIEDLAGLQICIP